MAEEPKKDEQVSSLHQVAAEVGRLILGGASGAIQEMTRAWAAEYADQCERYGQFTLRRQTHIDAAQSRPELLDNESGPPLPGWEFDEGVRVWMPPDLRWSHSDLPDEDEEFPLPPPARRSTSLAEKYAAFAAIYDYCTKGKSPLNPWAGCPNEPGAVAYHTLVNAAGAMDTNMLDEPDDSGERELWSWLNEVEGDLRPGKDSGATEPDGQQPRKSVADFDVTDAWVTLRQVSAVCGIAKRTLANYLHDGIIPKPEVTGGEGRANLWRWSVLRTALCAYSKRPLPEKFPTIPPV